MKDLTPSAKHLSRISIKNNALVSGYSVKSEGSSFLMNDDL